MTARERAAPRRPSARPSAAAGPAGRRDAPERIPEAALEVLKRDGYAGLTTAKVAAASGQNKALISYYFGSKRGLVAAVARRVSQTISDEILERARLAAPGGGARRRARRGRPAGLRARRGAPARLLRPRLAIGRRDPDVGEILAEMKSEPPGDPARAAARARPPLRRGRRSTGSLSSWSPGSKGSRWSKSSAARRPALAGARRLFISGATAAIDG